MSLEIERRRRGPLRAQVTRTVNELEVEITNDEPNLLTLREKLQKLEEFMLKVTTVDDRVMDLMLEDDCTEEEQIQEVDEVVEYGDKARAVKLKVEALLFPPHTSRPGSPSVSETGTTSTVNQQRNFKLPKIELKKFGGDLKEWIGFWAQFQKIDGDETLHVTDKFEYLTQALVAGSEASKLVLSFPRSAANYPKAVQELKERFGSESLLIQVYVRELLGLAIHNVTQKEKIPMPEMFLELKSHLRALESLNLAKADPSTWLFPLVESSLAEDTLRAWQRSPLSKKDGTVANPPKTNLDFLMEFLETEVKSEQRIKLAQTGFQNMAVGQQKQFGQRKHKESKVGEDFPTAAGLFSGNSSMCIFCEKPHESRDCGRAKKMTMEEKRAKVEEKKACFSCLKVGHMSKKCKKFVSCDVCEKKHYGVMCPGRNHTEQHGAKKSEPKKAEVKRSVKEEDSADEIVTTRDNLNCTTEVLLQTLMVTLVNEGRKKTVRVLCDTGSQHSYIKRETAEEMSLIPSGEIKLRHALFSGRNYVQQHNKYEVQLEKLGSRRQGGTTIEVLDQNRLCEDVPRIPKGTWMKELKKEGIWLSDVGSGNPEIDIMIGSDYYTKIFTGRSHQLENGLLAIETKFGWTLSGKVSEFTTSAVALAISLHVASSELPISSLWDLDVIGIKDPVEHKSKEEKDQETRKQFLQSVTRSQDGRYSVKLPWIDGTPEIPNNRVVAEKRLTSSTRKLQEKGQLGTYDEIFQSWLKEGIIESTKQEEAGGHFLPHHPVFKPGSLTTPVRPVFDASCKSKRTPSLNDCIQKGPNLMELLPSVLLRFRENKVGVISDIRKAFQMIDVDEADRKYLKFLWWEGPEMKTMKEFQHKRVVFGVNCSPFLLAAVLELHLKNVTEADKPVAEKLWKSLYVDNCVTSVGSKEEFRKFRESSIRMMADAKMELRCWEHGAQEPKVANNIPCGLDPNNHITSVLGLTWNKMKDSIGIDLDVPDVPEKVTKRSILSIVHKVFDPIGFVAPALIFPKVLLQEAWAKDVSWDNELDEEISSRFESWMKELFLLKEVKIPRHLNPLNVEKKDVSIHTFCDASQDDYAAVIFVRTVSAERTSVKFLCSKARVAPMKRTKEKDGVIKERRLSIPRLELMAATIGSRLTRVTLQALGWDDLQVCYWSDSTTAISWILRNDDWGTFVGNRVNEILSLTSAENWRHVPGKINPADLPSRGCSPAKLLETRWWEGPDWLQRDPAQWPVSQDLDLDEEEIAKEKRKTTRVMAVRSTEPWFKTRFLLYMENVRVMGWIKRFVKNSLEKVKANRETSKNLKIEEQRQAELEVLKCIQQEAFPNGQEDVQNKKVVIEGGLMRIKSKLIYRTDSMEFRSPVVLPRNHPLVSELIRYVHLANCHAGVQVMLGILRERYWILCGRQAVGKVIHQCTTCLRYSAQNLTVEPAPLPVHRVETVDAYQNIGVDLAGPLFLSDGTKGWIVLYTCAVYRAVHLDLVSSLSTEAFIGSLERFIYTNGRPNVVYSDNGTNFVGAVNLFRQLDWKKIEEASQTKQIQWKFNPPTAAWWGGWWERLVRSVKDLLRKMLGRAKLTFDEMRTCLAAVEATINTRPLTTVTEHVDDLVPLTPMMFIRSLSQTNFPEGERINSKELSRRFRAIQKLKVDLQARFRREYLSLLVQKASERKSKPPKVGDVVLVGCDNKKRFEWPLGRILELIPGKDSNVRTAKVQVLVRKEKTSQKERLNYKTKVKVRPLQRLFPLEIPNPEVEPSWVKTQELKTKQVIPAEEPSLEMKRKVTKDPGISQDNPLEEMTTRSGRKTTRPRKYGQWNNA